MWLSFSCHKEYTVRSCSISCPLLCFRHTHLIPRGTAFHSDAFSLICGYRQPCRAENKSVSRRVICGQEKKYKNHRRWVTDFIPPASSQAHALVAVSALQVQFFKLFASRRVPLSISAGESGMEGYPHVIINMCILKIKWMNPAVNPHHFKGAECTQPLLGFTMNVLLL